MSRMPVQSKLAELRAKTDRDLVAIVDRGLDRSLVLARLVRHSEAREGLAAAEALLPVIHGMTEAESIKLNAKLQRLRMALGRAHMAAGMRMLSACS